MLKITKIDNEDVYNMEVEKYHNFAVNDGLIVHNCMDCLRYICQEVPYDYLDTTRKALSGVRNFLTNMGYSVLKQNKRMAQNKSFNDIAQQCVNISMYQNKLKNSRKCSGGYKLWSKMWKN